MWVFIFMSKMNMGTLPGTQNTFSVLLDSVCAVKALITNCDKSQIATVVTVQNTTSQIDVNSALWYTTKYRKHVHIDFGPFQWVFLGTSIMDIITDIHANIYSSEITTKWAEMQLFIFMSKMNMGVLLSTQNTFSVLLDSICHVNALITNCVKSQIATLVSQFVTVAICDGSKYNFSDWCQFARRYTPKCRKDVHINIGPYQEGFLLERVRSWCEYVFWT